jgi:hypothetical protein
MPKAIIQDLNVHVKETKARCGVLMVFGHFEPNTGFHVTSDIARLIWHQKWLGKPSRGSTYIQPQFTELLGGPPLGQSLRLASALITSFDMMAHPVGVLLTQLGSL